jgi:hypothetical protein
MSMPSTLSHDELVTRATRGYQLLASPEGRRLGFNVNLLNPDTLEMSDGCYCALGETYEGGSYWDAVERLADEGYPAVTLDDATYLDAEAEERCPTYFWERMHGFILLPIVEAASVIKSYAALTDAWREVIKRERDGDAQP